ncbi:MAG: hypothetical protein RIC35_12595 [Marinoscillum sp.]
MSGSVALDVVIGLVFIYLLYSLLASIVQEIISTHLNLRAQNLREAISRMLNDDDDADQITFWQKISERLNLFRFNIKNGAINQFYDHQEISGLGRSKRKQPSAINATSFAKVVFDYLKKKGEGISELEKVKSGLKSIQAGPGADILGKKTCEYVESLLIDAQHDLDKFKENLNTWFDRTMEQTTEWYKQRVQIILLIIGFSIAWVFNADTFVIIKKLSVDKDLREQMVQLASNYLESNSHEYLAVPKLKLLDSITVDTTANADTLKQALANYSKSVSEYNERLDSLLAVKKELQKDIDKANNLLGQGSWLPDRIKVDTSGFLYPTHIEPDLAGKIFNKCDQKDRSVAGFADVTWWNRVAYWFLLLWKHFFGYLLTALALSLGAPFWFDLLNKLMQLRGTISKKTPQGRSTSQATQSTEIVKG